MNKKRIIIISSLIILILGLVYFKTQNISDLISEEQNIAITYIELGVDSSGAAYHNTEDFSEITEEQRSGIVELMEKFSYRRKWNTVFSDGSLKDMRELLHIAVYDENELYMITLADIDEGVIGNKNYYVKNSKELLMGILEILQAETADVTDEIEMKRVDLGDLDGNGVTEYCESYYLPYEEGQEYQGILKLFWNGECIYEYDGILRMEPHSAEYLDLDRDGEKELFFKFNSRVNDMPLDEYFVLKEQDNKWFPLEMIHGENMLDNSFPIHMTAEPDYGVEIGCEGIAKTIHINLEPYFKEYETDLPEYMHKEKDSFIEGESYGGVMAWGIWNIESGEYRFEPCLIASHSLCGNIGELMTLGKLDVYFNYDKDGKTRILDIEYKPYIDVEAIEEENSIEFSAEELEWFQRVFFAGEEWCITDQFVTSEYSGADNIDLNQLIYMGMGKGIAPVSDAEMQHFKETKEESFYMLDISKTTKSDLEMVLQTYAGMTAEEMNGIGLEYVYYWEETDAYYVSHGDVNFFADFVIESGKRLEDGRVKLKYRSEYMKGEVILKPAGDSYIFDSNQYTGSVYDDVSSNILGKAELDEYDLVLTMKEGTVTEDTEPGPFMGLNRVGTFELAVVDTASNETISSYELSDWKEELRFIGDVKLNVTDYNEDGVKEILIGQYGASNYNFYHMYYITEDWNIGHYSDVGELMISTQEMSPVLQVKDNELVYQVYDMASGTFMTKTIRY